MKRVLAASLSLAAMSACASTEEPPPPPAVALSFVDSKIFDNQLHKALSDDIAEVIVEFIGIDATVNNIPGRLDTWLTTIMKQGEERVQLSPDPRFPVPKSAAGIGITLALQVYGVVQDWLFYRPAQDYDALILYEPVSGRLTRIVFIHRPGVEE